jgi:hypothetical protein
MLPRQPKILSLIDISLTATGFFLRGRTAGARVYSIMLRRVLSITKGPQNKQFFLFVCLFANLPLKRRNKKNLNAANIAYKILLRRTDRHRQPRHSLSSSPQCRYRNATGRNNNAMKKRKWNKRANNGHTRTGAWAATPLCPSDDDVVCPVQGFFFVFF